MLLAPVLQSLVLLVVSLVMLLALLSSSLLWPLVAAVAVAALGAVFSVVVCAA